MPSSPIRKLVPRADAAKSRGMRVYHLNIGQPDLETPTEFWSALSKFQPNVLEYAHSEGIREVREKMALYYQSSGIDVGPEHLVVTTGGSEALLFALGAITDPGDNILVFEPYYTNYAGFARLLGIDIRAVTTSAEAGHHLPDEATIEAAMDSRTRAILLCNPANPTGTVATREELLRLSRIVASRDVYLLSDEVYREFVYDGAKAESVLGPCVPASLYERAIVIDSVSKRFSLCGARVGALVSRNQEIISAVTRIAQTRLSAATLEQIGSAALMSLPASYFETIRAEYQRRRDVVHRGIESIPGVVCQRPEGAFYVFAKLPLAPESGRDSEAFAAYLLDEFEDRHETVMVAPGPGFYATAGLGRQEIRLAYVLEVGALERAMELLKIGLERFLTRS